MYMHTSDHKQYVSLLGVTVHNVPMKTIALPTDLLLLVTIDLVSRLISQAFIAL